MVKPHSIRPAPASTASRDGRHLDRQPLLDGRRDPSVVCSEHRLRVGQLDPKWRRGIGQAGGLPSRITTLRHSDQENSAGGIGEHGDVLEELSISTIIVIVESALVFELEMLAETGVDESSNVGFADLTQCSSFP